MKIKFLILFICVSLSLRAQVPNTNTFTLRDVATAVYGYASTGITLSGCFTNAVASSFDPAYSGSKTSLYNFRNYGANKIAYSDWSLPSRANLDTMYARLGPAPNYGFSADFYWSSEEYTLDTNKAWSKSFYDGSIMTIYKTTEDHFRPIRSGTLATGEAPYTIGAVGPAGGYIFYVNGLSYMEVLSSNAYTNSGWDDAVIHSGNLVVLVDPRAPTVTTAAISNISTTAATGGGNVTSLGTSNVTARGVCWNTSTNPTTANSYTTDGTGAGSFTSSLTGLSAGTTYYVRAYATNSTGTAYGSNVSFISPSIPSVTSDSYTVTNLTTVTGNGTVTSDGGASVTARGYCWATTTDPTTSDNYTTDGTGTGVFTSSITGLNGLTTYYARAYATNSIGTAYGANLTVNTALDIIPYAELNTVTIGTSDQDLDVNYSSTNPTVTKYYIKIRIQNVSKNSGWIVGTSYISDAGEYRISRSETVPMNVTNATGDTFDIEYSTDDGATWTAPIFVTNTKTIPY